MDLEKQLNELLGDFSHLSPRIRHLSYQTDACGERIDVRCSYIAFRDGHPTFDDFVGTLANHVIPFCLSRSEIRAVQRLVAEAKDVVAAGLAMSRLAAKARALFIKARKGSHRSGEAGEVVLYLFVEWLLNAPQIVSKMHLKTNTQMPVHGSDGIHARFDSGSKKLHLYWGESKAHKSLSSALNSALESIREFVEEGHEAHEIEIVSSHADFEGLDAATKDAFLKYLDPYSEESNERISIHSCLLVFEFNPKAGDPETAEALFIAAVNEQAQKFINSIKALVDGYGLSVRRFEFFLLPVPSVQEFRDRFQAKIGWPP